MADTRYIKLRRQTWYFHIAVPVDLQPKLGKKHITETLGTRDLTKAQKARWEKQARWTEAFERLRGSVPLTNAEIEDEAQRIFTEELAHLEAVYRERPTDLDTQNEELALQADQLTDASEAMRFKLHPTVVAAVAKIEARRGVVVEEGSPIHQRLTRAITRALFHAVQGRRAALSGEAYEPPLAFGGLPDIDPLTLRPVKLANVRRAVANGMRFSEAAERFIGELQRDKGAKKTAQTVAQHEAVFRLFAQFVRDAALEDISREQAAHFLAEVAKLHPHWGRSPDTKKLTIWQLAERYGTGEERLSNRTLNRYVSSLHSVFKWARKRGVFNEANPFAEQGFEKPSAKETGWRLYTDGELQKLMNAPLLLNCSFHERVKPRKHDTKSALRWLPLLAVFTAMRQNELCQMHVADVEQQGGVWVFRVHADRDGQRLKTEAAQRIVPVHSELIRCGFLDYLRALPPGQLFPGLKRGGPDGKLNTYFSKAFTTYRRSVGVTRERLVFHSLRKNAAQALKNAQTTVNEIAELIGHERGFTVETYAPLGLPVPVLKEIVERIAYPRVDFSRLHVGHADLAEVNEAAE